MSADIVASEAVGKTIITPENTLKAKSASETEKAAADMQVTLKEKGADVTLKVAANRAVDQNISSRTIDENIGSERDDEGKMIRKDGTPEKKRYDDAKAIEKIIIEYLDKGYDKLSNDSDKKKVRDGVESIVQSIPALRAEYEKLVSDAERKALLEEKARNPNYSNLVAEVMNGVTNSSKVSSETISALQIDVGTLDSELNSINEQLTGANGLDKQIDDLRVEIKQLHPKPGEKSDKSTSLSSLRAKVSILDDDITSLSESRQDQRDELDSLQKKLRLAKKKGMTDVPLTDDLTKTEKLDAFEQRVKAAETNFKATDKEYKKAVEDREKLNLTVEYLDGREPKAREELTKALKEKETLEEKKRIAEGKLKAKKLELGKAKTSRIHDEELFVKNLDEVFTEAAGKYFEAEIDKVSSEMKLYLEKKATDLQTGAESALAKGLLLRYYYDKSNKVNLTNIRADKDKIVTIGPEEILEQGLTDGGYTKVQINKLKEDKTKWNSLMTKTAEISLKHYWLNGGLFGREGKMQSDEQMKIVNSPWGNEVLKNSVEAARKDVEAVLKQKLPDRSRIGEWLRKLDGKWLLAIIAILIAAGVLTKGFGAFG